MLNKIKHIHRRFLDPRFGNRIHGKGGLTLAYRELNNNQIEFSIAKCHERDNFCKAQGRVKSAGRLCSEKHRNIFNGSIQQFKEWAYTTPINMIGN